MRPDRVILGECRGEEAFDMLQAMNTGHEGSMATIHANTPRDAIGRLEQMLGMTGMPMTVASIRSQISSAIAIIVQLIVGHFEATGLRPRFLEDLRAMGIEFPGRYFEPGRPQE